MSKRRVRTLCTTAVGLTLAAIIVTDCSSPDATHAATPPPVVNRDLWGDMKPVVSVKELMRDMLDPLADDIFDAVAIVVDKDRTIERTPKTDEDWERVEIGAVAMAEGAYLLKVRRPFAPPGDENNSAGPDAVELSPAAITAKIERDPVEWNARIEALRNVGREVLDIVQRRDATKLWDAAEDLDQACEACHRSYWYPGETSEYYRRLDRRLAERLDRQLRERSKERAADRPR